jgi:predicted RNA-binding Zn ribbon-like protein
VSSQDPLSRRWVLPNEPRPVRLINTVWADRNQVHDDLSAVADLGAWFRSVALDVPKALFTVATLANVHDLRDAFRRLAAFITTDDRLRVVSDRSVADAIRTVNKFALASCASSQLRLHTGQLEQVTTTSGTPLESALSELANHAIGLFTSDDRERLTPCGGPGCVLYFMKDQTRRGWCGDACGNRARAARHYLKVRSTNQTS